MEGLLATLPARFRMLLADLGAVVALELADGAGAMPWVLGERSFFDLERFTDKLLSDCFLECLRTGASA